MVNHHEEAVSPRLARLQAELEAGNETVLDAFWRAIETHGTPLVEAIDGENRDVLMSLLWRHSTNTRGVAVVGGLAGVDLVGNQMKRLTGTNIWYLTREVRDDLRTTYQIAPNDPLTPLDEIGTWEEWLERTANWRPDPLNPHRLIHPKDTYDPTSRERVESVIELPAAPPHPWIRQQAGVPRGKVELHHIQSRILDDKYPIWIYSPPDYAADEKPHSLLVLFDGWDHLELIPTPTTLDNLLFDGSIRPTVAVLVGSPNTEVRMRDLTCHQPFAEFLADELIPWVHRHHRITTDPGHTIVGGVSSGGLAAAFVALKRPDLFGNVLSQSGAFWWKPEENTEPEWVTRQFIAAPRLPLRFYMTVGSMEPDSQLSTNRHLRDVLHVKEYPVRYVEYNGSHDYISWRGLLGDGLIWFAGLSM